MDFRITGLAPAPYARLFGLPDHALEALGIKRYLVDKTPGYPDRIEMRDAAGARALMDGHVKMIRARRVAEARAKGDPEPEHDHDCC